MMLWIYPAIIFSVISITSGNIQACGSELTSLLSLVCNNQFNSPVKRVSDLNQLVKRSDDSYKRNGDISKRNGVVDECCISSCTFAHLQLYCRFPEEEEITQTLPTTSTKTTTVTTTTIRAPVEAATIRVPWKFGRRWFFVNRIGRFMSRARRIFNMK